MINPSRQDKNRLLLLTSAVLLLVILFVLFSPVGVMRYYRVKQNYEKVQEANNRLEEQNASLRKEIDRLRNDPDYIEEIARKKYGMIKKNEVLYQFKNKK